MLGGSVQNHVHALFGDVLDGSLERESVFFANSFYLRKNQRVAIFANREQTAVVDAEFGVGRNLFEVDLIEDADAFALGAGALRRVEREGVRRRLVVGDA